MSRKTLLVIVVTFCSLRGLNAQGDESKAPQDASVADPVDFEALLRRPVQVEFADTPLADVIDYFGKKFEINIRVDPKGMTDAAVDPSAMVTLSLRKPVSLEAALRLVLEEFDLDFTVQDEILKITSKEKADEILTTKVYSVGDLLDRGPRRSVIDNLINTITSIVQPDTWDDNGGPGSITRVASTLVISQKYDVHKEIKELLAMLRAELPKRAENAAAHPNPDEVTTMVYRLDSAGGQDMAVALATILDPDSLQTGGIAVVKMKGPRGDEDRSWDALVVRQKASNQEKVQEVLSELGRLGHPGGMMGFGYQPPIRSE
ncbi:MAG TPA: hypothetical protein VHD36_13195 [Pirellulales bacterium]|nr:hypothetical protein [Pirellulales bacterium]